MAESRFEHPTAEQLARFVTGDPVAAEAVMALVVPQLVRYAIAKYGTQYDHDDLQSIVHDVAWAACRPPIGYRPGESLLTTYLINVIQLRVRDLAAQGARRSKLEAELLAGRENDPAGAYNQGNDAALRRMVRSGFYRKAASHLSPLERDVLAAIQADHRDNATFIAILRRHGITDDPAAQVKNVKAQLQRALRRVAREDGYDAGDILK